MNNSSLRFIALSEMQRRTPVPAEISDKKISEYFGEDVFTKDQMRRYLSKDVYQRLIASIDEGKRLDRTIASQVAEGMKTWAVEKGATHYTHWFQPLNDSTAEKHDAFIEPNLNGTSFESFNGNLLVQQEPDASSFPSGGLRNTFEARGYSAWDPSSPAFIVDKTLCEALDFKAPLLKSIAAVDKAAVAVCQLFDKDVEKVTTNLGWEQEYFLVDEALYNARPDLQQAGRTLMGHTAAKDQQLDDHYWGAIPERVCNFMKDFEMAAYRLGIPLKTRHNEAAPNQFECAPVYEEANIAVDHNVLLMTLMRKVAAKHHLKVLFHEKPFAGVNGSGKHCNWSLSTNTGVNLFSPGKNPTSNMQFLSFFVCTLKAAFEYGSLIMASIATETNSHRLGSNEAPPSIMSVFTGYTLSSMLDSIEKRLSQDSLSADEKTKIKLDIGKIPEILLDNTDRNRTSPFAFTGNRFEFRATGTLSNCSMPLIVINTAVAEELTQFKNEVENLIGKGVKKDDAILRTIRKFIIESKKIRFEGNGYSQEWHKEAEERGLKGIHNVCSAFKEYLDEKNAALFAKFHIFNTTELAARYEIKNEIFLKKVQIESRVIADMASNHIIPTAVAYQNILIENIRGLKEIFPDEYKTMAKDVIDIIYEITGHVNAIKRLATEMTETRKRLNQIENIPERAAKYEIEVREKMFAIREHIDNLEMVVDDRLWPLPKYRELLATL